jgi:hypothetical protein
MPKPSGRDKKPRTGKERRSRRGSSGPDKSTTPAPTTGYGSGTTSGTSTLPRTSQPARPAGRGKQPRQARLRISQVDPWSVTKTAFLLSIALGVVTVVAVAIVWTVLGAAGLWDSIDSAVQETIGDSSGSPFQIEEYIGTSRVLGFTMIVAVVDVVLITMIATLGAFLYNLAATLLGGVEVTLAEDD